MLFVEVGKTVANGPASGLPAARHVVAALIAVAIPASVSVFAQQAPPNNATPPSEPAASSSQNEPDRVIVTAVPVPAVGDGAPYFSPAELDAAAKAARRNFTEATANAGRCADHKGGIEKKHIPAPLATLERLFRNEMEAARRVDIAATRAADATRAAEKSRHDAAVGQVDIKEVETAELRRQKAVNDLVKAQEKLADARAHTATAQDLYLKASYGDEQKRARLEAQITWGELDFLAVQRRNASRKTDEDFARLVLTDIVTERKSDRKVRYLHVTGVIRNRGDRSIKVPQLRIAALDSDGWTLKAETADSGGGKRIKQGEAIAFAYDLRPAPEATELVIVDFASDALSPPRMQVALFDQCRVEPF